MSTKDIRMTSQQHNTHTHARRTLTYCDRLPLTYSLSLRALASAGFSMEQNSGKVQLCGKRLERERGLWSLILASSKPSQSSAHTHTNIHTHTHTLMDHKKDKDVRLPWQPIITKATHHHHGNIKLTQLAKLPHAQKETHTHREHPIDIEKPC